MNTFKSIKLQAVFIYTVFNFMIQIYKEFKVYKINTYDIYKFMEIEQFLNLRFII